MIHLKPSQYNVFIPLRNGRGLIHNTASGAMALLDQNDCNAIERASAGLTALTSEETRNLIYGGFLVNAEVDELQTLEEQYRRRRFDPTRFVFTVAPTLACNFGCDYCFQGCEKPVGRMSPKVQDAVVAFIERQLAKLKELHVAWYGGEPLLALKIIEALSLRFEEACTKNNVRYDAMIVTNGFSLTADVAQKLCEHNVKVAQVTLDGAAEHHDKRRTLLNGRGTFRRIINNIADVVTQTPLRVTARVNIDARNRDQIEALLDSLVGAGLSGRRNFSVYFAPVEAITEGCHAVSSLTMAKSDYAQLETELQARAFEHGLAQLSTPMRFRGMCGAIRPNGFVVTPTGDLHKCWDTVSMPEHRVGSVLEHLVPEEANCGAEQWLSWTPFKNDSCRGCRILPFCAGSCAHKFINPEQTRGEAATLPCPPWKFQIKERLLALALQKQVITPDDYDLEAVKTVPQEICDDALLPLPG